MPLSVSRAVPLAPAAILLLAFAVQIGADPAPGVTFSNSPFTDEGWNVAGARNWVLLGDWGAGNWVLHLVQLPFSVLEAVAFTLFGVGIVQARLLAIACSALSVALVGLLVGRRLGPMAGLLAASAVGGSTLLLYYGRLAFLENLVMLALVGGAALVCRVQPRRSVLAAAAGGALLAVAIGTKPLALFPALGILGGAWLAGRTPRAGVALATIGLAAAGWALVIGLPNREAMERVFEIWAAQSPPASFEDLLYRVTTFPLTDSVLLLSLPLTVAGLGGLLAAAVRWRGLDRSQRVLAGAAIGWLVVGAAVLLVASYRPGRYVLPLLPALAILSGFLVPAVRSLLPYASRGAATALAALALAGLVLPGAVTAWGWATRATFEGPALQARFLEAVDPPGPMEGGLAPFLAMRVPAPIYVRWSTSQLNSGDLYAADGIRWVVATGAYRPSWADAHPQAWERRTELFCVGWGRGQHCLERLPAGE